MIFVIAKDRTVTRFAKAKEVVVPDGGLRVSTPKDLYVFSLDTLLAIYNKGAVVGLGKPIEKFRSREDAHRKTFSVLELLAVPAGKPS